ncbi:MAG: thioredoxin domain-containing protein [Rhodospirillales bacterium]|nr:thioredoxin domain-containing protein [Rhodospirillales bacterium]
MNEPANLLRHETSPYLLQHAENPVHWRPWGAAALAAAHAAEKPILLSVGYAACHWCHVMAHESFEDAETAALMNALFVCIKVDREERPDIDHLYMSALHMLGEQGGWPLTMFLTPDGAPFWGGTYFPPEPRWGRPSFRQVLQGVANAWHSDRAVVTRNTGALSAGLARMAAASPGAGIGPGALDQAATTLLGLTDPVQGGLRGAPKFPNPPIFRFLWQNAWRSKVATEAGEAAAARAALHLLLARMSQGGIYDHLGGGYARYSTDDRWLVPHFEKMLYDNAQILDLLALAYADRPEPLYAARAEETVGWLLRDMRATPTEPESAFAASEDADSEGEEGRFYVWTEAEIDAALGAEAAAFKTAYDVTSGGNWEDRTILQRTLPFGTADEAGLAASRATLFALRAHRIRPGRDDKVLADWNGLTIAALARASAVFARPAWLESAEAAFSAVLASLGAPDGRVRHAWRQGRVTAAGLIDDQACMARAAIALFETTGNPRYRADAERIARAALAYFAAPDGGFFLTAEDAADVPLSRPRHAACNATPAGNGVMAECFARLWHLTGAAEWREAAARTIAAFSGDASRLSAMPTLLAAACVLDGGRSVVIAGAETEARFQAMVRIALAAPDPAIIVLRATDHAALPAEHPAHGKGPAADGALAYLCQSGVCGLPIADPAQLAAALRGA